MSKLIPSLLCAVSILTACASGAPPMREIPPSPPPEHLMLLCPELPQPLSGTLGHLLQNHVQTMATHHLVCEQRAGLQDWIRSQQPAATRGD